MTDRKWHTGPPPSMGWWPASVSRDGATIRWWDGSAWSMACHHSTPIENVGYRAAMKTDRAGIEWKARPAYWPKRSRT